jgi:AcrR family transcriptional regulator
VPAAKKGEKRAAPRRVRRTAEGARAAILDAAERRLSSGGPAALKLADVAADVGVAHPTVLHHFGSREALLVAVVERSIAALHEELIAALATTTPGDDSLAEMLERVAGVVVERGYGRIVAWVLLSGYPPDPQSAQNVDVVVRAAHAIRVQHHGALGRREMPTLQDTRFVVLLAALALFGEAIVGPLVRAESPPDEAHRFRRWLADLLNRHLEADAALSRRA